MLIFPLFILLVRIRLPPTPPFCNQACVVDEGEDEAEFEQDDGRGDAAASGAVAKALGPERRNAVLATLYVLRADTSSVVRQTTLQIWKTIVPNTPRTLREILPMVISQIIDALSSGSADRRTVTTPRGG